MSSIPGRPHIPSHAPLHNPVTPQTTKKSHETPAAQHTETPHGTEHKKDHGDSHDGFQLLSRVNIGNGTPLQKDVTSVFSGGFDIGVQNHFDHGRGHNELYLTPGVQMKTDGKFSSMLTANVHSKYVFDSGFLLSGGLHVGGEKELFSLEKKHDDHDAGHDNHDAGHDSHDAGHDSHGNGVHFHGATELQAGYQFKVGDKGVKVDLMGGGGLKTDFSHANPYVTAGSSFKKGNHKVGLNVQYGQSVPVTTNVTWTIALGGKKDH